MYSYGRVNINKTFIVLLILGFFVLCSIGFLGLIPKVHAFDSEPIIVNDSMDFELTVDTNSYTFFHLVFNEHPLTWNDFKNTDTLKIHLDGLGSMYQIRIHDDTGYIGIIDVGIQGNDIDWNTIQSSLTSTPTNLDEPIRFMLKGFGSPTTYKGSIQGYEIPKNGIFRAIQEGWNIIEELINIYVDVVMSNPLLIFIHSLAFVALMFWLFAILRV